MVKAGKLTVTFSAQKFSTFSGFIFGRFPFWEFQPLKKPKLDRVRESVSTRLLWVTLLRKALKTGVGQPIAVPTHPTPVQITRV
jgi:hypothetical protein